MQRLDDAISWTRAAVRSDYRDQLDEVDHEEIVADVVLGVVFLGVGVYGLYATGTTPRATTMGLLGAVGVGLIETMLVYFGVLHLAATRTIYRRSEPTAQFDQSLDGYQQTDRDSGVE